METLIPMKMKQERIAVPKDGKDSFFRKLQLDQNTMKLIRNYRVLKQQMDRGSDAREIDR